MRMEEKRDQPESGDAEFLLGQIGKGIQLILQAVLFILSGAVVVAWEGFGKLSHTVYGKGAQYGMDLLKRSAPKPPPQKIKVPMLAIDNYSQLPAEQIISRLEGLSPDELTLIKNFEMGQQNRSVILEAIDKRLGEVR
jgi:hypothetical protein